MFETADKIKALIEQSGLKGRDLKAVLREVVDQNWPDLPVWSNLTSPVIEEVKKAAVAGGVALTFEEDGVRKVVLARAGEHYKKVDEDEMPEAYMVAGGFIDLNATTGSSLVPQSIKGESPQEGGAREVEEELRNIDGTPLLKVDPKRLVPVDAVTMSYRNGERHVLIGMAMELTRDEVQILKTHIAKIDANPVYRSAAAIETINPESGLPEVEALKIFTLDEVLTGQCKLLHQDQMSLFQGMQNYYKGRDVSAFVPKPAQSHPAPY